MSSETPLLRVVNMDYCAFNPPIASTIAPMYTGLGLLAQNNLLFRKFRFRTVKPRGARQGRLGQDSFSNQRSNG